MNENFKRVAAAVKTMNTKGAGIFGNLMVFAIGEQASGYEALVASVKTEEKAAKAEMKVDFGKNSTYKAAKSIILRSVEAGIPLQNASGEAKGKTELEGELEALKTPKSEADKFASTMATATTIAGKLSDAECLTAAALVQTLLNSVASRIKIAA